MVRPKTPALIKGSGASTGCTSCEAINHSTSLLRNEIRKYSYFSLGECKLFWPRKRSTSAVFIFYNAFIAVKVSFLLKAGIKGPTSLAQKTWHFSGFQFFWCAYRPQGINSFRICQYCLKSWAQLFKLKMSLVNDSLKFTPSDTQIC